MKKLPYDHSLLLKKKMDSLPKGEYSEVKEKLLKHLEITEQVYYDYRCDRTFIPYNVRLKINEFFKEEIYPTKSDKKTMKSPLLSEVETCIATTIANRTEEHDTCAWHDTFIIVLKVLEANSEKLKEAFLKESKISD